MNDHASFQQDITQKLRKYMDNDKRFFFSEPLGKYSPNFAPAGFKLRVLKIFRMVGHAVIQRGILTSLNKHACISI